MIKHTWHKKKKAYKEELNGKSEGEVPDRQQRGVEQARTQMCNMVWQWYSHMRGWQGRPAGGDHSGVGRSHSVTVADVLPLAGLVSSQWGSISPARPGQASLQCQPPSQGLSGTNIRNQPGKYEFFIKYLLDFQNISDCQQCLSCKHWKPVTSNLQSRYSPSQLGRAFHWLDITLGHDPPHAF